MAPTPHPPADSERDRAAALKLVAELQRALPTYDRATIVDLLGQLVALRAPLGQQWIALSQVATANGEVGLARAAIELYVEQAQGDPAAAYKRVALLAHVSAWREALALLRTLPPKLPDPASYAYSRGTAAMYCGEAEEAREWLDKAIAALPLWGSPWLALATLTDFAAHPDLAEHVFAAERAMAAAPANERALYGYALGKAHADLGEHAAAFAAFAEGAALVRQRLDYSRERDSFTAGDAVSGYSPEGIAALAARQSEPTGRAIFVNGLPRSGTTLVEHILTSHSTVSDGGEVNLLPLLLKDIGGLSLPAVSQWVEQAGAPEAARLWSHWLGERFPAPGRVVDKTFNSSRLFGLAATLLPQAPLVWLTRDPLDCAWSCFRSYFVGGAPWSYDLEDIAFHMRLEDQLLDRWRELLGERLLVVPFEALVTEPERWIRKLVAHCGLAEEPQVFAPHENPRTVTTSSTMQVRRPINRKGIGAAEPYREFLGPFVDAYCD